MIPVLDLGYVRRVTGWGSDEAIIEAARMSTDKGFEGWGPNGRCTRCGVNLTLWTYDSVGKPCHDSPPPDADPRSTAPCEGAVEITPGDEKLLRYLWEHAHFTPFEMAGLIIEVKAPIFVFREWHRHRTQSYNEMSARYIPLPDENYNPTLERLKAGLRGTQNRQQQGLAPLADDEQLRVWLRRVAGVYGTAQTIYEDGLKLGVPKEVARLVVPVARYSRMRASANLRNWLGFLKLRQDPAAQWEIRQYAEAVGTLISQAFPRTYALFKEGMK